MTPLLTPPNPVIVITGIDTDIGKTYATGWYARHLMNQGYTVITQKLVQTGCTAVADDIVTHRQIQGIELTKEDQDGITCPYVFSYPCSPHLAADMAGITIDTACIINATNTLASCYDYVLIEGAGGLAVPYNKTQTTLDYIANQGYPIVLVTSGRLGSINHTLLSLMVCQARNINVYAVFYNTYAISDKAISADTKTYLQNHLARHHKDTVFWEVPVLENAKLSP